jgi:hypothetical protein
MKDLLGSDNAACSSRPPYTQGANIGKGAILRDVRKSQARGAQ